MPKVPIKIFISSPGDVRPERIAALEVIDRLKGNYPNADIDSYYWEDRTFTSNKSFQAGIDDAALYHIVVIIWWGRLGTPINAKDGVKKDGKQYESGTVYELERALEGSLDPDIRTEILTYRKTDDIPFPTEPARYKEARDQFEKLNDYIGKTYMSPDDGSNLRAIIKFRSNEFKGKVEHDISDLIERRIDRALGQGLRWHGSPYVGLNPFEPGQHPIFFGRERIVDLLSGQLEMTDEPLPFLLIIGPSGVGKSSLVRAGLIPRWEGIPGIEAKRPWCIMRPSDRPDDPYLALWLAVQHGTGHDLSGEDIAAIAKASDGSADYFAERLTRVADALGGPLLIVLDQLEELLPDRTRAEDGGMASVDRFFEGIKALLTKGSGKVRVVGTLRSDLVPRSTAHPALIALMNRGRTHFLDNLEPDQYRRVIRKPAEKAGWTFEVLEGQALNDCICSDALDLKMPLPLLQFALDALYRHRTKDRSRSDNVLAYADYEAIGGVGGALSQHTQNVVNELKDTPLQELLSQLVSVSHQGEAQRRYVPADQLSNEQCALADRLVDMRLLTRTETGPEQKASYDLAHEMLLEKWDALRKTTEERRNLIALRSRAEAAAGEWEKEQRSGSYLWKGSARDRDARELLAQEPNHLGLSIPVKEFLEASRKEALRSRRIRRTSVMMVILGLLVWGISAYIQNTVVANERDRFQALAMQEARTHVTVAKDLIQVFHADDLMGIGLTPTEDDTSRMAIAHLLRAIELDSTNLEARAMLYSTFSWRFNASMDPPHLPIYRHTQKVLSAAFDSSGRYVVTASGSTARIWDLKGDTVSATMKHDGSVRSAAFDPSGRYVVTASEDGTARIWNLKGDTVSAPMKHNGGVWSAAFDPSGQYVVTASDSTARIWDWKDDTVSAAMRHRDWVSSVAFDPSGQYVVTASDWTARVWDLKSAAILDSLENDARVRSAAFDPSGRYVVTAPFGSTAYVWDLKDGTVSATLRGYWVNSAAFDPSGRYVVTASANGTARVWGLKSDTVSAAMKHGVRVNTAAFDPSGQYVVTDSEDGTARVWNLKGDTVSTALKHDSLIRSVAFSPSGQYVATASRDRTARIWDLKGDTVSTAMKHDRSVRSAELDPSGQYVVTASGSTARIWDLKGDTVSTAMKHDSLIGSVAFSPSGQYVVTASRDHTARIWDLKGDTVSATMKHDGAVRSAAFDPSGRYVVTASEDGTARIWNLKGDTVSATMKHNGWVWSAAFDPSGQYVVTASVDRTARVWDLKGDTVSAPMEHEWLESADFDPSGQYVVTASMDGITRTWNLKGRPFGLPIEGVLEDQLKWGMATLSYPQVHLWPRPFYALLSMPTKQQLEILTAINGHRLDEEGTYVRIPQQKRMRLTSTVSTSDNPWDRLIRWLLQPSKDMWADLFKE